MTADHERQARSAQGASMPRKQPIATEAEKEQLVEPVEQNPVWKTGRAVRYQNKPEMPER